jgi:uncharacterized protein YkwD
MLTFARSSGVAVVLSLVSACGSADGGHRPVPVDPGSLQPGGGRAGSSEDDDGTGGVDDNLDAPSDPSPGCTYSILSGEGCAPPAGDDGGDSGGDTGGGNGDDSGGGSPPADPPSSTPDPDGWSAELAALEDEMLVLVNELRAQGTSCGGTSFGPRPALRMEAALRRAARLHSKDMADNGYFSHTSQDGRSPWDRIGEAGYTGSPYGENIAAGNTAAQATFQQWVNSPGHCQNMMTGNANEIGIGVFVGSGGYGAYWTQTFGAR